MRLTGIVSSILGCLVTILGVVFPVLGPLVCVGVLAAVFGLILALAAGRIRAAPTEVADGPVKALFEGIATDPEFLLIAGLEAEEGDTLLRDLATAAYRFSPIIQGGYAGRARGRLILALSRRHLRRGAAAHELFHLARDVMFRRRGGRAGQGLDATSGILREELTVWLLTLSYLPFRGAAEIVLPIIPACLGAYGAYLLSRFIC